MRRERRSEAHPDPGAHARRGPAPSRGARRELEPAGRPLAELAAFRERLRAFERRLAAAPAGEEMSEAVHELQLALEEVEVADEELTLQNEELLSVREELELQRHRYQDLFELAPDGYVVTGLAGVVQEANRAALDLFQTSEKAMRGKPLIVYVAEQDRARFRVGFPRLKMGERLAEWELTLQRRDRSPFPAVVTVVHEAGLGRRPPELRWIVRDVSARRETEQALRESEERLRHAQRLESIGRLTGGIAHAFNNLLGGIAFHAELLDAGLEPEGRLHSHLAAIEMAVERAGRLASQLLAFGRKQILSPRRLSINATLEEMSSMLRDLVGEHIALDTCLDPQAGEVDADLAQLEQVILNLVVNARDAMPEGGRCRLETRTVAAPEEVDPRLELPPGRYVRIAVADTGGGMSDEVKAHLFEPFFTTKERGKGSGLGLATVYGIVRQSGGRVRVESAPGEGSRFEIYLPRAPEEGERPAAAPPPAVPRRARRRDANGHEVILLVEDEDNIREPAVEVLEGQGYTVLPARSGEEALEVAGRQAGPIHLMVTDVIMPGLSGGQLAERLAAGWPDMKVLFISGYPEDSISRHGVLDPGKSFLQKPFHPGQFLRTVRQLLDGKAVVGS